MHDNQRAKQSDEVAFPRRIEQLLCNLKDDCAIFENLEEFCLNEVKILNEAHCQAIAGPESEPLKALQTTIASCKTLMESEYQNCKGFIQIAFRFQDPPFDWQDGIYHIRQLDYDRCVDAYIDFKIKATMIIIRLLYYEERTNTFFNESVLSNRLVLVNTLNKLHEQIFGNEGLRFLMEYPSPIRQQAIHQKELDKEKQLANKYTEHGINSLFWICAKKVAKLSLDTKNLPEHSERAIMDAKTLKFL